MDKNLKIALILTATDKASRVINSVFTKAEHNAKIWRRMGKEFNEVGDKALIAGGAMTAFFGETVLEAQKSERAARILNASFANLGEKGAKLAKQGKEFAENWQLKIGIKDEDIEAVETKFAAFPRMFTEGAQQAQLFQRATKLAFDLQAAGFGDAASNADKLGKFENNPVANMNALSKVLGKIEPQQKAYIDKLISQNKLTEAQSYGLSLVEKRFNKNGSIAEAAADAGDKFKVGIHKIAVEIGTGLLPKVNELIGRFLAYLPKIEKFIKEHKSLIIFLAKTGVALLAFGVVMRGIGFILGGVSTAFKLVGISAKVMGVELSWSTKGIEAMKFAIFALRYHMMFTIIPAIRAASVSFMQFGAALLANPITWYIAAAVALAAAAYLIYRNWDKLSAFFVNLWSGIKKTFFNAVNWVEGIPEKMLQAGKNIIGSIWSGMKAKWNDLKDWFAGKMQVIRNFLPFSPAKIGPLRDIHKVRIMETIAQTITAKPLLTAMNNAMGRFANHGGGHIIGNTRNTHSQMTFAPVIHLHGSASTADANNINAAMKEQFKKMMREYESNKGRVSF